MVFRLGFDKSLKSVGSDESTLAPCLPSVSLGLTVLHPEGDDKTALVDIVTVHGLSGHPQNTWTNFTTEHFWPLQSLPEDIPRSRIMAFGYNTSVSPLHNSTALISDIAKQLISHLHNKRTSESQKQRPIIFIAHSLGGIVIKEFLHIASNTGNEDLASSVCGILFLGTPHRGSHTASFMDVVSGILKPLLGRPADAIIKDLSSNSRHLQELDQILRFTLNKIDIYSFYELLPMKPMKKPVVERHSALLNVPSELEQIALEADHRQMCKPPDRSHFIYETIAQRVINVMNRQIEKAQYSNDLMEMTNKFATKQMEHIMVLTKELHEGQIGPDVTMMFAIFQQTLNLHVMPTGMSRAPETHGFEDVLKSLPTQKVKVFVDGIQKLMERAKSLQDMLVETERQNERRKAQARIEAERRINEQQIQELLAENARLKAKLGEGHSDNVGPSYPTAPHQVFEPPVTQHAPGLGVAQAPDQAFQPRHYGQSLQIATGDLDPRQANIQRLLAAQRSQVLQNQQQMQKLPMAQDSFSRPPHPSDYAEFFDPTLPPDRGGPQQNTASVSDRTEPPTDSPGSIREPTYPPWTSSSESSFTDQMDDEAGPRRTQRRKEKSRHYAWSPAFLPPEDREEPDEIQPTSFSSPASPLHTDPTDGQARRPRRAAAPTYLWPGSPSETKGPRMITQERQERERQRAERAAERERAENEAKELEDQQRRMAERRAPTAGDGAAPGAGMTAGGDTPAPRPGGSMPPPAFKRRKLNTDSPPGPAPTDSPEDHQGEDHQGEDHQGKVLTDNRLQMVQMVGTLSEVLQIGMLVLNSGEPAVDSSDRGD
ncbi:hypothetical protein VMCG_01995 [Cytospora schulzeri]|uniref:DUF676 domain-containing protein n=1 Tax=Cytospora schulzeri TaxID=448051 RepID=A0A423X429_9PEZI|nr:hypothetical protein VMCG_01995 [Valsa malicola]